MSVRWSYAQVTPTWLYVLVLCATILIPQILPFTAGVIKERQKVVEVFTLVATCTMPVALLILVQIYAWAFFFEILGFEEPKKFRQGIDGQTEEDLVFDS